MVHRIISRVFVPIGNRAYSNAALDSSRPSAASAVKTALLALLTRTSVINLYFAVSPRRVSV